MKAKGDKKGQDGNGRRTEKKGRDYRKEKDVMDEVERKEMVAKRG